MPTRIALQDLTGQIATCGVATDMSSQLSNSAVLSGEAPPCAALVAGPLQTWIRHWHRRSRPHCPPIYNIAFGEQAGREGSKALPNVRSWTRTARRLYTNL